MKKSKVSCVTSEWSERVELNVSGAFAWNLRLSQLCTAAPVTLRPRRAGLGVRVSPMLYIVNCWLMTIFNVISLGGVVVDFSFKRQFSTANNIQRILWVCEDVLVMSIASSVAYSGLHRVTEVLSCSRAMKKITATLGEDSKLRSWSEKQKRIGLIVLLLFAFVILIIEYARFILISIHVEDHGMKVTLAILYLPRAVAYLILLMLELQFALSAVEVCDALSALNDGLERLLKNSKCNSKVFPWESPQETVRRLTFTFATISDAVKRLCHVHGLSLVLLLLLSMLHFLITPFQLIRILNHKVLPVWTLMLKVAFCLLHYIRLMLIIEPPHMTLGQVERTQQLVNRLMMQSTEESMRKELNKFSKYLLLNKTEYLPLGVCSMRRSLLTAMLGSVATYLVIIVKFQAVP